MSKFDKTNNAALVAEVAQKSNTLAKTWEIKMIKDENLIDCPYNEEDLSYTADIEKSIDELGFRDPIEVTTYKQPPGKYMITSGHRRRVAGRNRGFKEFPCLPLNREIKNDAELKNLVLMANCHRNTGQDPLLYFKRFLAQKSYIENDTEFNGGTTELIDIVRKRLGVSETQAWSYYSLTKVIEPVLEMVRDEIIAPSAVRDMTVLSEDKQMEVYNLLQKRLDEYERQGLERELSRREVKQIIKAYKNGEDVTLTVKVDDIENNSDADTGVTGTQGHIPQISTVQGSYPSSGYAEPGMESRNTDSSQNAGYSEDNSWHGGDTDDEDGFDPSIVDNSITVQSDMEKRHAKNCVELKEFLEDLTGLMGNKRYYQKAFKEEKTFKGKEDINDNDKAADMIRMIGNACVDFLGEIKNITNQFQVEDMKDEVLTDIIKASNF